MRLHHLRGFGTTPVNASGQTITVTKDGGYFTVPPTLVQSPYVNVNSNGQATITQTSGILPDTGPMEWTSKFDTLPFWAKALIGGAITAVGGLAVHVVYKKALKGKA